MNQSSKKSIAIWQPYFRGGGAEAVALWILEALKEKYDVTLYTLNYIDFEHLNKMYDTSLLNGEVKTIAQLPQNFEKWVYSIMAVNDFLRMFFVYWTLKRLKQEASQYDVVFSTFNAVDLGCPGIQYLHWVKVVEDDSPTAKPWFKYLMRWVNFSYDRLKQNFSIVNSQHTADRVREHYGIVSQVVFPPVTTEINALSWADKENAFLCSGRIVEAKSPHRVIDILKKVREQGFDIQLHLTGGGGDNSVYAQKYLRRIESLVNENSSWITLHQNLPYSEYLKIVAKCRYGIHVKPEPFGISVAEMLKAGMIPFVRSVGGQREIVGDAHPEILFADDEECVSKIIQVLRDNALQANLLESLHQRKALFSTERFVQEIRAVVAQYLHQSKKS